MKISNNIDFSLSAFHGQRVIFQGASGSGKSNGARLLLEATYGMFQHIVLDVEDEFHTLRTAEREYAILGGDHGDVRLVKSNDPAVLAQTLLKIGVSTVLQIGDWKLAEKRSFIGKFIAGMMAAKSDLWHPTIVMLDESHQFCPQATVVESSEAITHLATAGRKRGYSAIFATQRLSLISKDVLGQCENKFMGRVEQSLDRRAVADLLGFTPRSDEALEMQGFKAGEFYAVGPALAPIPTRARLYKATTEAPKPGSTVLPTATPAAIQKALQALAKGTEPVQHIETHNGVRAGTDGTPLPDPALIERAEQKGYKRGYDEGHRVGRDLGYRQATHTQMLRLADGLIAASMLNGHSDIFETARDALKAFRDRDVAGSSNGRPEGSGPDVGSIPTPVAKADYFNSMDLGAERKPLAVLVAAAPAGFTEAQWASLSGFKRSGGTWNTYKSRLRTKGAIEQRGDLWYATDVGIDAFGGSVPTIPSTPEGRIEMWKSKVAGVGPMLDALHRHYPQALEREELAAAVSLAASGGTFGTYLSRLRSNGLVEEPTRGAYRISEAIMRAA